MGNPNSPYGEEPQIGFGREPKGNPGGPYTDTPDPVTERNPGEPELAPDIEPEADPVTERLPEKPEPRIGFGQESPGNPNSPYAEEPQIGFGREPKGNPNSPYAEEPQIGFGREPKGNPGGPYTDAPDPVTERNPEKLEKGEPAESEGAEYSDEPPTDDYDSEAWKKYYAKHPEVKRSVGAAGENDPKTMDTAEAGTEEEEAAPEAETEETEPHEDGPEKNGDEGEEEPGDSGDEDGDDPDSQEGKRKIPEKFRKLEEMPRDEKISDSFDKPDLDPWLKRKGLSKKQREDFKESLQKGHEKGEEHTHLKPYSDTAEKKLQQWLDEQARKPVSEEETE